MTGEPETVRIHYRRPPDRDQVFEQRVLFRGDGCVVTMLDRAGIRIPMRIDDRIVLEPDSPIVWFTFEHAWHDIGLFHDAAGRFTGWYANILTPVEGLDGKVWHTTDLFLDVWREPDGKIQVLDRDEFEDALRSGWIDEITARRAREEVDRIVALAENGEWPPGIVIRWGS